jgi:cyclopropane fatty-acyl-phospholipid synthase-like methyltransferase
MRPDRAWLWVTNNIKTSRMRKLSGIRYVAIAFMRKLHGIRRPWGIPASAHVRRRRPQLHVALLGSALTIPAEDKSLDKCISIEAAQHFEDLSRFAREAHRVLKPAGTLALATFFTCHDSAIDQLRPLIATIDNGIDVVTPIASLNNHLRAAGFVDLRIEAIGELVWHGCDAWRAQTEYSEEWGRNWLKAYKAGLIDYYIVIAEKAAITD